MGFDPASLAIAATIGSTVLGVGKSIVGAANERENARQAEQLAQKNRKIALENAQRTLIVAQQDQFDQDMRTAAQLGEQEVIQAGSGLKLNSGSFIQTRKTAKQLGRIDALNVREAAEIRAEAYRNDGDTFAAEAASARRAGSNALLSGFFGVGSSLIGGASAFSKTNPIRNDNIITVPGTVLY